MAKGNRCSNISTTFAIATAVVLLFSPQQQQHSKHRHNPIIHQAEAFTLLPSRKPLSFHRRGGNPLRYPKPTHSKTLSTTTSLFAGNGIATNYTWREEQFEIDVTVPVPAGTRGKDLKFYVTPSTVDLRLVTEDDDNEVILLDGSRKLRGKICVDGTYWAISDRDEDNKLRQDGGEGGRLVTVTIEKFFLPPENEMEVIEYDWFGLYPDDEEEVSERTYDEPEVLDVREYAASLGVDIDNINMSLVDKSMFSSGLNTNMTRKALEELEEKGYVAEVTQQADGSEYVTGEDGQAKPYSAFGEGIHADEAKAAMMDGRAAGGDGGRPAAFREKIPFIDTPSPWQQSMPVEEARLESDFPATSTVDTPEESSLVSEEVVNPKEKEYDEISKIINKEIKQEEKEKTNNKPKKTANKNDKKNEAAADPIDLLTVARLKEILREQKLKVSGTKQELRDRLRSHVELMLKDEEGGEKTDGDVDA